MCAELELEFYYQNASTADATIDVPIANTITKQRLHLIASWLDLSSILLYLVMVLFIILYQQRVLEEVSAQTVTVTDYSVQVWDLPKVHISAINAYTMKGAHLSHRFIHHQRCTSQPLVPYTTKGLLLAPRPSGCCIHHYILLLLMVSRRYLQLRLVTCSSSLHSI